MLGKILGAAIVLATAALTTPTANANPATRMLQCENCATIDQMKNHALGFARANCTGGEFHVFSLKNKFVQRIGTNPGYPCGPTPNPSVGTLPNLNAVEEAFAHMLDAEEGLRGVFTAQQVIIGDIGAIGPGHNPVDIAAGGRHGGAFGSFDQAMRICFTEIPCVRKISPTLASLVSANRSLAGLSISILGSGGGVNWENIPPTHQIWLCNSNADCALIKFENGEWKFIESRSEGGRGIRYPEPDEQLTYQFNNVVAADMAERGFRDAGYSIFGDWTLRSVMACSNVGGARRCDYYLIPQ